MQPIDPVEMNTGFITLDQPKKTRMPTSEARTAGIETADSAATPRWPKGRVLEGLYRIEGVVAEGGMGVIYLATDMVTQRSVVVKTLLPSLFKNTESKRLFLREIEEWVRIGVHPNIIRAHTVHEIDYMPCVIAEYADGGSLYDRMQQGPLSPEEALDIAVQICHGMEYAHAKGLVHRDLKTPNVLLAIDSGWKITDFGLAKRRLRGDDALEAAQTGRIPPPDAEGSADAATLRALGTPEYMSPEQWEGYSSGATDIYAFGVILYEMFCGRRPFEFKHLEGQERSLAFCDAHCKSPPPPPEQWRQDLPPALSQLILHCLAKEPEKRPKHFSGVARTLHAIAKAWTGIALQDAPASEELDREGRIDQAWSLLRLGAGMRFRGEVEKAHELFREALASFETLSDSVGIIVCGNNIANIYLMRGDYDQALYLYQKTLKLMRLVGDIHGMGVCFNNLGNMHQLRGEYENAEAMYRKSLEVAEVLGNREGVGYAHLNLGSVMKLRGRPQDAMPMYEQALRIARYVRDRGMESMVLNNIANIHMLSQRIEEARDMYQRSLEIAESIEDRAGMCQCCLNLGAVHTALRDRVKAREAMEKSLEIARALHFKRGIAEALFNLGRLDREENRKNEAAARLKQCVELMNEINHPSRAEAKKLFFSIY